MTDNIEIQELFNVVALRTFVDDDDFDLAVATLLKRHRDLGVVPSAMAFVFREGRWEIILWGEQG